jgi:serine/threonine-protein kinase
MAVGQQLCGRYTLREVLGAGGMGVVYRAVDGRLGREVAVKVVDLSSAPQAELARFEREALAAGRLRSANVVTVHDVGEDLINGVRVGFLVMELLEGAPLNSVLAGGLPSVQDVASWGRQIVRGLQDAHAVGVVHRDIKPSNVILSPDGTVAVIDFGIARLSSASEKLTVPGTVMGTPSYMAPEQLRGEAVDERCDLYGLGCVLYELLTGQPPFGQGVAWAEEAKLRAVRRIRPEVPAHLEKLVLELLSVAPAGRPNAAEAERCLSTFAAGPPAAKATKVWDAVTQTAPRRRSSTAPPARPTPPAPSAAPSQRPERLRDGSARAAAVTGASGLCAQLTLFTEMPGWAVTFLAAVAGLSLWVVCASPPEPDAGSGGNALASLASTIVVSVYVAGWSPVPWWGALALLVVLSPVLLGCSALICAITSRLTGDSRTRVEAGAAAGLINAAVLVVLIGGQVAVAATVVGGCGTWLAIALVSAMSVRPSAGYAGRHQ